MARPGGLGRGLEALIPTDTTSASTSVFREIPLDRIVANEYQPRHHFDEEALQSLADSIRELGVLQPVLVREVDDGRYELVAGERRFRAARRAGLRTLPAVVRDIDDVGSLARAVVENIHREDLHPLEEAAAYRQLIEDFGLTHDDLGRRLGRSRAAISNTLRLLQLSPAVQKLVADGELSAGHARALLGTPDRESQEALAERIVAEGMSVRAVEAAVRQTTAEPPETPEPDESDGGAGRRPVGSVRPAALLELEELLAERLATTVRVQMGARKGRITIDFATLDDLERIFLLIQSD